MTDIHIKKQTVGRGQVGIDLSGDDVTIGGQVEEWKRLDRPCPPCAHCGAALYERSWGNGGWVRTSRATGKTHEERDCITQLQLELIKLTQAILASPTAEPALLNIAQDIRKRLFTPASGDR